MDNEMTWTRSDVRLPTAEEIKTGRLVIWRNEGYAKLIERFGGALPHPRCFSHWFLATDPAAAPVQTPEGESK